MGNNMLRRLVLVLGLVAIAIYHECRSCSVPAQWKIQEVSERALMADIVIVGKVDRSPYRTARKRQASERQLGPYDARFEILCTLKGGPLPAFINASGFGRVPGHCVNSRAQQNKTYIGFLRKRAGRYFVAEINNQRGTVSLKQHLLRRIIKKLGIKKNRNGCPNLLPKDSQKTTKSENKAVAHRHEPVETKKSTTTERKFTAQRQSIRGGSNGAYKTKPAWPWAVSILLVIHSLGCVLT